MIIQSLDGKWYKDPRWEGKRFYINTYDAVHLEYQGRVTWATARRVLPKLGIKAKLAMVLADTKIILGGRLWLASVFKLRLIKPIPEPEYSMGHFEEAPQWEGKVLSWKLSGKQWIQIGEISFVPSEAALNTKCTMTPDNW